jgi:hypothetical protein
MKSLVCGTYQFQHCAATFLLSRTWIFDSSCIQSLATLTILTYGVKTTEQLYGSRRELRHKQMQCSIKHLSQRERKDVDVFERIILMSKNENGGVCVCVLIQQA